MRLLDLFGLLAVTALLLCRAYERRLEIPTPGTYVAPSDAISSRTQARNASVIAI